MIEPRYVLALDQGTTSTRAILFDGDARPVAEARRELPQSYPASGWVEHDPERIRDDAVAVLRGALEEAGASAADVAALGITNQRETTVLWERATGRPVHPALVWQDRRTADHCRRLKEEGREEEIRRKTGLLLDPYFSATKLSWLLEEVDGARAAAGRGELAFGTVDTWLLWHLTGGRVHATDATNASRTLLFDIHRQAWDDDLLELFGVPRSLLPEVRDSAGDFGRTDPDVLGDPVPVAGIAGDQQAAAFGQAAIEPGSVKATFGTGAFLLMNTGDEATLSGHRLLTTVAWRRGGRVTYALEGSVFSAGSAVQWIRDELGLVETAEETEALAAEADPGPGPYLVPAFTGLGAPHWDTDARGALVGLTRDAGRAEVVRATLASVAYQTRDLVDAMAADAGERPTVLRVDGGLARNGWAMGFLADLLDLPVERPTVTETTARGAALLAGSAVGFYDGGDGTDGGEAGGGPSAPADRWERDARWEPSMEAGRREELYAGWRRAVARVLTGGEDG